MDRLRTLSATHELLALAEEIRASEDVPWAAALEAALAELPRLANDVQHNVRYHASYRAAATGEAGWAIRLAESVSQAGALPAVGRNGHVTAPRLSSRRPAA